MQTTEDLNKTFGKGKAPVNICQTSIKLFREDADAIIVLVPRKTTTSCCKVKKVALIYEVRESGSSIMMERTTTLLTREMSFIKITYEHPRSVYGILDVCKVVPKAGAHGVVWTSIDAGASSGSGTPAEREGYGVLVGIKSCCGNVRC